MTSQDLKLEKIGILMLGVKDLKAAVAFYSERLGLPLQMEIPGFAFLNGGGITLALSQPLARASQNLVGATELVFQVTDVHAAYRALRERGVSFNSEPHQVTPSDWAANFTDPDGHRLSVFGPPGL